MRVWQAALLGGLPCSISSLQMSPVQETKLISSLYTEAALNYPPVNHPCMLSPFLLPFLPPSVCPTHSTSNQIITRFWCIRLPGSESASRLISISLCPRQRRANVVSHWKILKQQWFYYSCFKTTRLFSRLNLFWNICTGLQLLVIYSLH